MIDEYKRKMMEWILEKMAGPWEREYVRSRMSEVLMGLTFMGGEVRGETAISPGLEVGMTAELHVSGQGGKIVDREGKEVETILEIKIKLIETKMLIWANYYIATLGIPIWRVD